MIKLKNLREIFDVIIAQSPDKVAYQLRIGSSIRQILNKQFLKDVRSLAAFLIAKQTKCCAVVGENSYKQQICYYAAIYSGAIVVPIDKELTAKEMSYIINAAKCDMLFCGDTHSDMVDDILVGTTIEHHIFLADRTDKIKDGYVEQLLELGYDIIENNPNLFSSIVIDPDATHTYVFTSGTTGVSKGVMLSHNNIIANIKSCDDLKVVNGNVMALLPMHHTLQSTLGCTLELATGKMISINNSVKLFAENMLLFKPTDFICVPLILETMHQNVWNTVRESGKEGAFKMMMKVSSGLLRIGIDTRKIFFKKIHAKFGGNMQSFFCGGALLDPIVARDIYAWGFNMYIGYGITECSPLITNNTTNRVSKFGSCGFAMNCNEVKLIDIDANGDGEIVVKGTNVMLGYLDNPEATADAFIDGWYRTGDIGRFDKDNFLYITGRKKNIIVLTNGKNIYPEEVEGFICKYPEIKEAVVFGGRNEIGQEISVEVEIFPNFDYAKENKIEDVKSAINNIIEEINEALPYYKRITNVIYRDVEFPKTTTKKIKRHKL